jgi:hypothetical protein
MCIFLLSPTRPDKIEGGGVSRVFNIFTKKMTATMLYSKISSLPPSMIKEVDNFVDFLKSKKKKNKVKERKFGCAKGLIIVHDDFDAPLEEFKDYM